MEKLGRVVRPHGHTPAKYSRSPHGWVDVREKDKGGEAAYEQKARLRLVAELVRTGALVCYR